MSKWKFNATIIAENRQDIIRELKSILHEVDDQAACKSVFSNEDGSLTSKFTISPNHKEEAKDESQKAN